MTTRVYGRIVEPDGDAASLDPADGYVRYTIAEPGVAEGAVRARGGMTVRVTGGVVEDAWLAPGRWRASYTVTGHGSGSITFDVADAPVDLAQVAPVAEIDGQAIARGESAFQVAQRHGFTGSEAEWLASLRTVDRSVTMTVLASGAIRLDGPGVVVMPSGAILLAASGDVAWSANPLAAAQDRPVTCLTYDPASRSIYSGFGDWTANGDVTGVVAHDLDTGEARVLYRTPSEGIGPVLRLAGSLYAPYLDPVGYWEPSGGYASDESGEWATHPLPGQPEHVLDMAETPDGLWACGSAIHPDQATMGPALWHRPTGGEWQVRYLEPVTGDGTERYQRIRVEDGRAWVQAPPGRTSPMLRGFTTTDQTDLPPDYRDWSSPYTSTVTVEGHTYTGLAGGRIERTP